MRTQGYKSPGRAISLRFPAGLMKKKGSVADMSTIQEGSVNRESRASPGIRTLKTSHTGFLNWITYGRDLSPDITEKQQRTCPVCDSTFPDRRNMLQHIPTCGKMGNGLYTCIHCNKREKIGRYHMNECKEVHSDQNWLKRIMSFRTSKIIVDDSKTRTFEVAATRSPWERVELPCPVPIEPPCLGVVSSDTRIIALELESAETSSASTATAESLGELADVYEMECNWAPVHQLPQGETSEYTVNSFGGYPWIPRYGMEDIAGPQELASNSYDIPELENQLNPPERNCRHDDRLSLPSQAEEFVQLVDDIPLIDDISIVEEIKHAVLTQNEPLKPLLRLDTGGSVAVFQHASLDHAGDHANDFLGTEQQATSDSVVSYTDFPSPLNSPVNQHGHDIPVSPMDDTPYSFSTSMSSRFSSMSEVLSDNTPTSSFSSAEAVPMHNGTMVRVFEDKEMCFDPEDIDSEDTSNDGYSAAREVYETMYSDLVQMLGPDQSKNTRSDIGFANMSVQSDSITNVDFIGSPDDVDVRHVIGDLPHHSENVSAQLLAVCVGTTKSLHTSLADISYHQSSISINLGSRFASASPATTDSQQSYATSPNESLSPEDHLGQSPKPKDRRRPLSRSPAIRYKCTYGACTFEPTGKKAYYRRSFQRHQETCPHSPFARPKKPCRCTFPGCGRGFSRSDGLNAHRTKTGHDVKIELQFVEGDDGMHGVEGYS